MEQSYIIKKQLEKIGNKVYLSDGSWTSMPFYACISLLWRKKSSAFEPKITEIGTVSNEYYLYLGPHNHDITKLSRDAIVLLDGMKLQFQRRDAVRVHDKVIYYTGILKKLKEGEYDEY